MNLLDIPQKRQKYGDTLFRIAGNDNIVSPFGGWIELKTGRSVEYDSKLQTYQKFTKSANKSYLRYVIEKLIRPLCHGAILFKKLAWNLSS